MSIFHTISTTARILHGIAAANSLAIVAVALREHGGRCGFYYYWRGEEG